MYAMQLDFVTMTLLMEPGALRLMVHRRHSVGRPSARARTAESLANSDSGAAVADWPSSAAFLSPTRFGILRTEQPIGAGLMA